VTAMETLELSCAPENSSLNACGSQHPNPVGFSVQITANDGSCLWEEERCCRWKARGRRSLPYLKAEPNQPSNGLWNTVSRLLQVMLRSKREINKWYLGPLGSSEGQELECGNFSWRLTMLW
jgi:hypothetical protein